jgi:hypothetical protein
VFDMAHTVIAGDDREAGTVQMRIGHEWIDGGEDSLGRGLGQVGAHRLPALLSPVRGIVDGRFGG